MVQYIRVIHLDYARSFPPKVGDRHIGRDFRSEPRETRIHEAAGVVLLVSEQGKHFFPRGLVQQGEQFVAPFGATFLDKVHRIVGRKQPHPDVPLLLRQTLQYEILVMGIEGEEKISLFAGM